VGETVKLATDALRESDDLEGHPEDVRQLGELVRTLRGPEPLGEPLASIVRHAIAAEPRERWTLAELATLLQPAEAAGTQVPQVPEPAAPAEAAFEPPAPPTSAPAKNAAVPPPVSLPAPSVPPASPLAQVAEIKPDTQPASAMPAAAPPSSAPVASVKPQLVKPEPIPVPEDKGPYLPPGVPPVRRTGAETRPKAAFPKWIIAAMAILLLLILLFNLRRNPGPAQIATAPATAPESGTVSPGVAPAAPGTATAQSPAANHKTPPGPVLVNRPEAESGKWHVIAFTYHSRARAAQKVKAINKRWPELHAEVFNPKGARGFFLVALGGGMTREAAAKVKEKAHSLGVSRDTYVQNYSD
jgi:hypothetical protein